MKLLLTPRKRSAHEHPTVTALRQLPALASAPQSSLEAVAHLGDLVDLQPGHVLMREGAYGREVFLLIDGAVDVVIDGSSVARLGGGDVVGELAVLDPRRPRNATVVVASPTTAIVLDPRSYRSVRDLPGLEHVLVREDRYVPVAA